MNKSVDYNEVTLNKLKVMRKTPPELLVFPFPNVIVSAVVCHKTSQKPMPFRRKPWKKVGTKRSRLMIC